MRVLFVILAVLTGGGFIIVYLVLALVLPVERSGVVAAQTSDVSDRFESLASEMKEPERQNRVRNFFGFGLILLGLWLLLGQLFPGWYLIRWDYLWPVILIVLGLIVMTRRNN